MRLSFLNTWSVFLIITVVTGCIETKIPADKIFFNGEIITMAGDTAEYIEAVAISKDKIIGIGRLDELNYFKSDSTEMIDLGGRIMTPGFIDPHIHPMLAAILIQTEIIAFNDWKLPHGFFEGVKSDEAYISKLKEKVSNQTDNRKPMITWGYHDLYHGNITRVDLDRLFPDRPVIIWQYSFHQVIMNSSAINLLGLNTEISQNHHHIDLEKGSFYETGMAQIAAPAMLPYILSPQNALKGMSLTAQAIRDGGITTIGDMAMPLINFDLEWRMLKGVLDRKEVPFRTFLIPNAGMFAASPEHLEAAFQKIDSLSLRNSDKLQFLKHIKLFSDGAFYAQLMRMKQPYTNGHEGAWLMEPMIQKAYIKFFWDRNYRIHVHANGDEGVEATLDIFEEILSVDTKDDHRFTLHHVGYADKDQIQKMGQLGVHASVQPYYVYAIAGKYAEVGLGEERACSISPIGLMIDNEIITCLHSDFFMAPSEPLQLMWVAVNRKTMDGRTFGKELRISPYEALKAVTINAAYHLDQEEFIGSIEVGKKADFTILGDNPLKVDPEDIKDIEVVGTVFEGVRF